MLSYMMGFKETTDNYGRAKKKIDKYVDILKLIKSYHK